MPETTIETKPARKAKAASPFLIGAWIKDDEGKESFVPCAKQPAEDITEFSEMLVWAKNNLKGETGLYSFVRRVTGTLRLAEQTLIKATLE